MKAIFINKIDPQQIPNGSNIKDISNKKYGRLLVLAYAGKCKWYCLCDCGNKIIAKGTALRYGSTNSCGCYHRDRVKEVNSKHGESHNNISPEYSAFHYAKFRCSDRNKKRYKDYAGRGIQFRFETFEDFLKEVGRKPTKKHSLDRIDNNSHYQIGNVRWATPREQLINKNNNIHMTIDGVTKTQIEWCEAYGIKYETVSYRRRIGWCHKCAITIPFRGNCFHKS